MSCKQEVRKPNVLILFSDQHNKMTMAYENHPDVIIPNQYPGIVPAKSDSKIQLFNLISDVKESNNIANEHPELVKELLEDYTLFIESLAPN